MVTFPRKFRRNRIWKWCVLSIGLVLLSNVVILYGNFSGIEEENMIDTGGTDRGHRQRSPHTALHSRFDKYGIFESHLRKLMEKSTEDGLDVTKIENTAPFGVSYSENLIECEDFGNITNRTYLASGWTKAVFRGVYKGQPVAIKTVDIKGQDVSSCMAKGISFGNCYHKAAKKIVKEIIVLQALANDNVIKVYIPKSIEILISESLATLIQMQNHYKSKITKNAKSLHFKIRVKSSHNFCSINMFFFQNRFLDFVSPAFTAIFKGLPW